MTHETITPPRTGQQTATIIPFPVQRRLATPVRRSAEIFGEDLRRVAQGTAAAAQMRDIASGSAWYHEAAMCDERPH